MNVSSCLTLAYCIILWCNVVCVCVCVCGVCTYRICSNRSRVLAKCFLNRSQVRIHAGYSCYSEVVSTSRCDFRI